MRAPRYQFPEQVRSTTREMAARMIRDEEIVETPEQLEAWIALHPEAKKSLEGGGYGSQFSAQDLFPLLQARLPPVAPPEPERPARRAPSKAMLVAGVLAVLVALAVVFALAG